MSTWTAPYDGTFHFQAGREPHDFLECDRRGCDRSGTRPWIAKGTMVDTEQVLARANEQPPTRGQSAP